MKNIVVRQEDEADCGACCLLSVIKYYNGFIPLEYVKVDTLTTKEGTTFYNLKVAAEKYGFEVSGKREFDLSKIKLPAIAQIKINNFYHFVEGNNKHHFEDRGIQKYNRVHFLLQYDYKQHQE